MIETLRHDPLCPTGQKLLSIEHACWFCDLIAKVRADERERAYLMVESKAEVRAEARADERERIVRALKHRIADDPTNTIWADTLREAIDIVRGGK